jgi:transposase InsO family protein
LIGNDCELQQQIISALHDSSIGGHSGFLVTYKRLKNLFAWQGMKAATQSFVQSCLTCQQANPLKSKYPRLLSPLPVPEGAWQVVTMDFIEGLPKSDSANCILVVVDKFSKYGHFIPLLHPYSATSVAQAFLDNIYKLHGMPTTIVSDRDRVFTNKFWQELFKLANVALKMSSAYHPQIDGQSERVNQCLETFLRCFVHPARSNWRNGCP